MKKNYQTPTVKAIEFLMEDILNGSVIDPTNKSDTPVVVSPSIDIKDLF